MRFIKAACSVSACLAALAIAGCRCGDAPEAVRQSDAATPGRASTDASPEDDPGPSAVALVVVDTLRPDFLPFYGHTPNAALFLHEAMKDAVIFENAYATSSWTVPSMASVHTGLYPSSHGIFSGEITRDKGRRSFKQPVLPEYTTTMAEAARARGYKTIGVVANQHLSKVLGFAQGFDHYSDKALFMDARRLNRLIERHFSDAFGEAWGADWKRSKTFVWLHYFDPHDPYTPRIPWARRHAPGFFENPDLYPANMVMTRIKEKFRPDARYKELASGVYESEIAFWDDQFNRLAAKLGLWDDDVLVVFVSDHGEEFGEHGGMGHGNGLFEEVVRVPLAIRWPKRFEGNRRIEAPVSLVDLYPTIAELAGFARPAGLQGTSLVPLLLGDGGDGGIDGGGDRSTSAVLMELHPPRTEMRSWREGHHKLIRTAASDASGGHIDALYDLAADPGERTDISKSQKAVLGLLRGRLEEFSKRLPPPPPLKNEQIEDELFLEQLINMDYVRNDLSKK